MWGRHKHTATYINAGTTTWHILLQHCLSTSGENTKFSVFSGDSTQKGEVLFKQWTFEVKSVMPNHTEATLREGIVHLLWGGHSRPGPIPRSACPSITDNK